jgi:hypothetical protein
MPRITRWLPLALVLLLAAALRLYDLSGVPTELSADELEFYNSAASFAATGHDVDGERHLFFFSANPGRNPPIYSISEYPFAALLGPSPFSLRLAAAVYGLLTIGLLYLLVRQITQRDDVAVLAALFAAIAPILVHFSRIAWQPACELPFMLGGLYGLSRGLAIGESNAIAAPPRVRWLMTGAIVLGLTAYTYMASWLYALLLGGALLGLSAIFAPSPRHRRAALLAYALVLIVAAPALYEIFIDPQTAMRTSRIDTFRLGVTLPALRTFAMNYLAQFKWSYLAVDGDPVPGTTWRYLNGMGAFYWWIVPLAVLGAVGSFTKMRSFVWRYWLWFWLLIYPLGSALTDEGAPNAPRTLAGAPVFCVFAAIGAVVLLDWARSQRRQQARVVATLALTIALTAVVVVSTVQFAVFYFTRYVHQASNAWDSGTAATFAFVRAHIHGHQTVCFSLRPAWYALDVYTRYYLNGERVTVVPNLNRDVCRQPGSMVVTDTDHPTADPRVHRIAKIDDVDGNGFAYVGVVSKAKSRRR